MIYTYVCGAMGAYNIEFKNGVYDDASLYQLRHEVAELFYAQTTHQLRFKLGYDLEKKHYGFEDEVERRNQPQVSLIGSRTGFVTTFATTDVFLIEAPSTSLLEILVTEKPALVLSDERGLRLRPEILRLLRKRVAIAPDPEAFTQAIDSLLRDGFVGPLWQGVHASNRELFEAFTRTGGRPGLENITAFLTKTLSQRT